MYKRQTRLINNDRGLTYRERLKKLGLTTLETRRLHGDMIEVFKIFKDFDDVKVTDFFSFCQVLDLEAMNLNSISLRLI